MNRKSPRFIVSSTFGQRFSPMKLLSDSPDSAWLAMATPGAKKRGSICPQAAQAVASRGRVLVVGTNQRESRSGMGTQGKAQRLSAGLCASAGGGAGQNRQQGGGPPRAFDPRNEGTFHDSETCLLLGFQDLDCVNLHRSEHVRAKDNPLAVGRKRRIRLEAVIVLREVDQFLRTQMIAFRREQVDPLAVSRPGHTVRSATVAGEVFFVGRFVVVNRPVAASDLVALGFTCGEGESGEPEFPALGRLQVVPDGLAVGTEKLVPGDLHVHLPVVDLAQARSVGANGPDAIDLVPWAFMAEHDQTRIGR